MNGIEAMSAMARGSNTDGSRFLHEVETNGGCSSIQDAGVGLRQANTAGC